MQFFSRSNITNFILSFAWLAIPASGFADDFSSPNVKIREQMVRRIDSLLAERWAEEGVVPAPVAKQGEFLRRASLDLNGVIPRASEVRQFLSDERPEKRSLLIDQLLASPRYASHFATVWRNRILPHEIEMEHLREAVGLHQWLRERFARNLRYDNLVEGLLLATGDEGPGPGLYFRAHDLVPEKIASSASELFLGLDLQCAQCHDHPFADWSQRDFWGFAAFFARVRSPDNPRRDTSYRLIDSGQGEVLLPDTEEVVPPKFLQASLATEDRLQSRRMQITLWMTSRDNRLFVRAAVDWAWSHLFGRRLVVSLEHVDELESLTNSQLLEELADYFVDTGFDLQELLRTLTNTRAYQLSGHPENTEANSPDFFASMLAKPLTPEQLYDSFLVLSPLRNDGGEPGGAQLGLGSMSIDPRRMEFIRRMRSPPGDATEFRWGTLQALMLMNGQLMDHLTSADRSRVLGALNTPFLTEAEQVEAVFLATLSRPPTAGQLAACVELLRECDSQEDRVRALGDMLWAIVNSTEFGFNR